MLIRAATEEREREREPSFAFDTATAYTGDMSKFQRVPSIMLQRSALFHNPKQSLNTNIFAFYQPSSVNHFSLVPSWLHGLFHHKARTSFLFCRGVQPCQKVKAGFCDDMSILPLSSRNLAFAFFDMSVDKTEERLNAFPP